MFNPDIYLRTLIPALEDAFGERLAYVGLQGSYLRGEAHEGSDIDIMVVIDQMTVSDLDAYRGIIQSLDHPEKSCGFICSKEDLAHWNPLEIFHVLNCTKDCFGTLSTLMPPYTRDDIVNFVRFSLNNLYHEICHRYIHADREKSISLLPFTFKGVFFILQNLHYLRTGIFAGTKAELRSMLSGKDLKVLELSMTLDSSIPYDFDAAFECLFTWCQETLKSL